MEKVSVIIPTYKNRGGLVRAVNSVLEQNWPNIEVIVVDDNPPDSDYRQSTEILMEPLLKDGRLKYIKHAQNKNGAAARNTGLKASGGVFIAFLDDDDWFLEDKIKKQVEFLKYHTEYDAVYCLARRKGKQYGNTRFEGNCTREMLMLETCIYTPCQMFRREAIVKIEGYDESFRRHQDYDLMLRFFYKGFKIGCLPEILTEIGAERTCEWKQEVAELRQCNSETWTIQGYGLNVDSRKNGKR